jgi:hypothetical protein
MTGFIEQMPSGAGMSLALGKGLAKAELGPCYLVLIMIVRYTGFKRKPSCTMCLKKKYKALPINLKPKKMPQTVSGEKR